MMRRTASMLVKVDKARRDRALSRRELGTDGGIRTGRSAAGLWWSVKVVDDQIRKLIDDAVRLRKNP